MPTKEIQSGTAISRKLIRGILSPHFTKELIFLFISERGGRINKASNIKGQASIFERASGCIRIAYAFFSDFDSWHCSSWISYISRISVKEQTKCEDFFCLFASHRMTGSFSNYSEWYIFSLRLFLSSILHF